MTDRERRASRKPSSDPSTNVPLNPPDVPVEEKQAELEGRNPDQTAYFDRSAVDGLGELGPTDIYEGELEAGVDPDLADDNESLELLTELEMRDGETDDAMEAIEEGLTYVAPMDPPTAPSADSFDGAEVASGFGASSLEEEYDADHHSGFMPDDDEMTARVRDAFRADSLTNQYADTVAIRTRGGVVLLRGIVDDLGDTDNLVAVASDVTGVTEVREELRVRGMR
jgi:hypothetical protein